MSLTQFVKRPAIKSAFKALAIPERTPVMLRGLPLLVPDSGGPHGLVGTAFDFLARYHIAREFRGRIKLYQSTSVIDQGLKRVKRWDCSSYQKKRWGDAVAKAQAEGSAYSRGKGNIRRLADLVQYLAQIERLYRAGMIVEFDERFRPRSEISDEILQLLELFDPVAILAPQEICFLNPNFALSPKVGGADADIIVDDRLLDLKTVKNPRVSLQNLLQLAGYAALQRAGGVTVKARKHPSVTIQKVEIYFARFGRLVSWHLDELFPKGGFARFCEVFLAEIDEISPKF